MERYALRGVFNLNKFPFYVNVVKQPDEICWYFKQTCFQAWCKSELAVYNVVLLVIKAKPYCKGIFPAAPEHNWDEISLEIGTRENTFIAALVIY